RLRMAAHRQTVPGASRGARLRGQRRQLGGGVPDGVRGDVRHRHAGFQALDGRSPAARGERRRRLADLLESFPAGLGDAVGLRGGCADRTHGGREELGPHSPIKNRALLEMRVETLEAAVAAARGGADRIELCENLSVGGVTPRRVLMDQARIRIDLPVYAMIRPRGGNFHYNDAEFAQMKSDVLLAREARMDGIV